MAVLAGSTSEIRTNVSSILRDQHGFTLGPEIIIDLHLIVSGAAQNCFMQPCASAALSAGGYSLSADVDQLPVSSRPMDDELGTFWAICHMRKICTKLGAFSTRREVGLGDLAPPQTLCKCEELASRQCL